MLRLSSFSLVFVCGLAVTLSNAADPTVKLNSGYDMPMIGLGTYSLKSEDVDAAFTAAFENGYRYIDTGFFYQNLDAIGTSLKKWFDKGNKREDMFITVKVPPFAANGPDVIKYLNIQLNRLQLDYVDLFLIHHPWTYKYAEPFVPWVYDDIPIELDYTTDHLDMWKEMENQVRAGKVRSLGFCNFNESQILRIINNAKIPPSNLQIELTVYQQQKPLRALAAKHNISVTGYSTMGSIDGQEISRNKSLPYLLEHPTVVKIGKAHKKSPAQILLRHSVQNGIIVIPKSHKPERIKENHEIFDFELTADELKELNDLDKGELGRFHFFITYRGNITSHPEYPWHGGLKLIGKE